MSDLRVGTVSDLVGTGPATLTGQHAAKALSSFNQTNVIIDYSFNVSSITDRAAGAFTVNYTNSFNSIKTVNSGIAEDVYVSSYDDFSSGGVDPRSTTSTMYRNRSGANSSSDSPYTSQAVWGDLA